MIHLTARISFTDDDGQRLQALWHWEYPALGWNAALLSGISMIERNFKGRDLDIAGVVLSKEAPPMLVSGELTLIEQEAVNAGTKEGQAPTGA